MPTTMSCRMQRVFILMKKLDRIIISFMFVCLLWSNLTLWRRYFEAHDNINLLNNRIQTLSKGLLYLKRGM